MLLQKLPLGVIPPLLVALADTFKWGRSLIPRGRCLGLSCERGRGGASGFAWGKRGEASLTMMKQRG